MARRARQKLLLGVVATGAWGYCVSDKGKAVWAANMRFLGSKDAAGPQGHMKLLFGVDRAMANTDQLALMARRAVTAATYSSCHEAVMASSGEDDYCWTGSNDNLIDYWLQSRSDDATVSRKRLDDTIARRRN
ncbi:unnamed protein product [Dovyalis caffra]|uniref:Uncharacterized protein n=1 Tax=Dovyalis caffra TaxID=77055 RepID=A0AAV1RR47_9ROSI|nr:unnamed protein product [Dovyalis caffra]